MPPDRILYNGRISTLDRSTSEVSALAVAEGKVLAVGSDDEILALAGPETDRIDLRGRRAIPGLNDSHLHVIRAGLFYNLELRWDGVPTLAQALDQLKAQADRTPPPQWVRVIGGWSEFQFAEGRMPTLDEINKAAPDTPVFILHLYDSAMLNRAALRALGFDERTPNSLGGLIARDASGKPTGLLLAEPNAYILYSTIANAPKLSPEDQINSSRHYMRELNRFGVTSVSDAGGGGQNYPDDYGVINALHRDGHLTVRITYSLFAQKAGEERADYARWLGMTRPGAGDSVLRVNGAGENLVWSAADFENFLQPRPDLRPAMEAELEAVVRMLAEAKWPWRIHATYDESISRFLDIFERVHHDTPIDGLRWFFDHAETVSERNLERIAALGGGIAIQHRMAYQGEYFIRRYGKDKVQGAPPIQKMLSMGLPVGGTALGGEADRLTREEALRRFTQGSAWFSGEDAVKGILAPGYLADVAVLDRDVLAVPEDELRGTESVLTLLGGEIVYGAADFADRCPDLPPVSPAWSPVAAYGGYDNSVAAPPVHAHTPVMSADGRVWETGCGCSL